VIRYWSILGSSLATLTGFGPAEAAPQQLLNKTVTYSYTYHVTNRDPDGRIVDRQNSWIHTAYVSRAGRIFERLTLRDRSTDIEPNSSYTGIGEARSIRFESNRLVNTVAYASGANRVVVSFDPAFSSCTVDVVTGKGSGGVIKKKERNGKLYENLSHSVSGNSCSIRDGNPFAN
jgi:hypothetical protein